MFTGAAGAQLADSFFETSYLNTGAFLVASGQRVNFSASLDDFATAQPATVLLQLFDQNGVVVAQRQVSLEAGKAATLPYTAPRDLRLRAHAQVMDPELDLVQRRTVMGTVEVVDDLKAEIRFVCSVGEGVGSGRIPD
jgi:hypothetical protein